MQFNKLFNKVVLTLGLLTSVPIMASPCNNTSIEIYNQTETPLTVVNNETMGNTIMENIGENDVIPANGQRLVKVFSGPGTYGNAKGVITLINRHDEMADINHKFISLKFDFSSQFGVTCSRQAEVLNANSKEYSAYLISGYSDNVKLFIVGK